METLSTSGNRNYVAAKYEDGKKVGQCGSIRAFCSECSSMLWVHDDQWKQVSPVEETLCHSSGHG